MERVLYNTVLGAKRLEPDGHAFYYSDYNNRSSKTYFPDRWPCCSGTLPQVAADYHVMIYFRDPRGLCVNLYLPSGVQWTTDDAAQLSLTQSGDYPNDGRVHLQLRASRSALFRLHLRIPSWANTGAEPASIFVNGTPVAPNINAGFATIERTWKDGDQVELTLPMPLRLEAIDREHPDTVALMRGPLVLFALAENPQLTRKQVLTVENDSSGRSRIGDVKFAPFFAIEEQSYSTYLTRCGRRRSKLLLLYRPRPSKTPGDLCQGRGRRSLVDAEQIGQPKLMGRVNEASLEGRFAVIIVSHLQADQS